MSTAPAPTSSAFSPRSSGSPSPLLPLHRGATVHHGSRPHPAAERPCLRLLPRIEQLQLVCLPHAHLARTPSRRLTTSPPRILPPPHRGHARWFTHRVPHLSSASHVEIWGNVIPLDGNAGRTAPPAVEPLPRVGPHRRSPSLRAVSQRKGIASLVLEKSKTLRAEGAVIGVHANGWHVLEQLGVAAELRETAHAPITAFHDVRRQGNKITRDDQYPVRTEFRCLNRKDLIEALAKDLPAGAIRFGCQIAAVHEDPSSHGALLTMVDGTTIKAKALIGCEGTCSVVAKYLGLPPVRAIPRPVLRGFTRYPHGHPFEDEFLRLSVGEIFIGRFTLNENLVHFSVTMPDPPTELTRDPKKARGLALEDLQRLQCPAEIIDLVRESDPASLNVVTKLLYRPPWEVAFGGFQKGTVTVAGDAMHAMGPFIGQGGSAGLEDAVVLARALARAVGAGGEEMVGKAIAEYIRERRLRLARLSLESFVVGLVARSPSPVTTLACAAVSMLLGTRSHEHAKYDCGRL